MSARYGGAAPFDGVPSWVDGPGKPARSPKQQDGEHLLTTRRVQAGQDVDMAREAA